MERPASQASGGITMSRTDPRGDGVPEHICEAQRAAAPAQSDSDIRCPDAPDAAPDVAWSGAPRRATRDHAGGRRAYTDAMGIRLDGIHFLVTYRCTYACDHCFVWGSPDAEGR